MQLFTPFSYWSIPVGVQSFIVEPNRCIIALIDHEVLLDAPKRDEITPENN